jgi:hypothetical protein
MATDVSGIRENLFNRIVSYGKIASNSGGIVDSIIEFASQTEASGHSSSNITEKLRA